MTVLKVNGTILPSPSELSIQRYNLVTEAGRSPETGDLFAKLIARKIRIDAKWKHIPDSTLKNMLDLIDGNGLFFTLTYIDAGSVEKTITAYRGNVQYGLYMIKNGEPVWLDISIPFIQK